MLDDHDRLELFHRKKELRKALTTKEKGQLTTLWSYSTNKALRYDPNYQLSVDEEVDLYEMYVTLIIIRREYTQDTSDYPYLTCIKPLRDGGRWCADNTQILTRSEKLARGI